MLFCISVIIFFLKVSYEFINDVKEKISKTPNFERDSVESLLELLPYLDKNERRLTIEDINSLVEPAYISHTMNCKNPALNFPSEEESRGDGFVLGEVCAGDQVLYPFELTRTNLTESIFGVGRSGAGKSTFLVHFIDQIQSQGHGVETGS